MRSVRSVRSCARAWVRPTVTHWRVCTSHGTPYAWRGCVLDHESLTFLVAWFDLSGLPQGFSGPAWRLLCVRMHGGWRLCSPVLLLRLCMCNKARLFTPPRRSFCFYVDKQRRRSGLAHLFYSSIYRACTVYCTVICSYVLLLHAYSPFGWVANSWPGLLKLT